MDQRFSDMIIMLATGVSQRRMYFDAHPRVAATARDVAAGLSAMMRDSGGGFAFGVYNSKFVHEGSYLVGPSIAGRALIDFAERLGCGGFAFAPPLDAGHLTTFFRLGAERMDKPGSLAEAQALFDANGLPQVRLLAPLTEDGGTGADDPAGQAAQQPSAEAEGMAAEFAPLLQVYQAMYDAVAANTLAVHGSGAVDLDLARESGLQLVNLSGQGALDVMQFMRYPDYDSYTVGHSVRVAALSAMLGRALGWPSEVLTVLATAGLLHDLGKGRIPEEILFKAGKLDADERRVIEAHPALGARILLDNGEVDPVVISATWAHHIRHDAGGYPAMPDWYRPGAVAEVVHVCDVFEALTAHRPYKKSLPPRKAYEIMLNDAGAFHPVMLAKFISILGLYPPGSEVQLSDGRTAVVVAPGRALDRPRVRVTSDQHGLPLTRDDQPTVELDAQPQASIVEIASVGAAHEDWNEASLSCP
jgi:putative nucleotidyltransferase with HDIG domain